MLKPGLPFSTLSACCSQLLVEGLIKVSQDSGDFKLFIFRLDSSHLAL